MTEHRSYWLSCTKLTVRVETDVTGTIIRTAPVARKFMGQKIDRLVGWMSSHGGFEMEQIGGPPAETRSQG